MTDLSPSQILYEDDYVIAVDKPSGLPSQGTLDPSRDHCFAAVQRYLAARMPSPYVGLHHRLDAQTSGVLLMTKSRAANTSISEQFQTHTIRKTYLAVCTGAADVASEYLIPDREWLVNTPIGEQTGTKIQKFCVGGKNRKSARTQVRCLMSRPLRDGVFGVYACTPETGRTHQIRVHLASLGLPIVCDTLYGTPLPRSLRPADPHRLCLHAAKLEFTHPITGERITVEAPEPEALTRFIKKAMKLP
ncbi:MAG: RluA family pseudouridine synthase [Proteobacteria bacterium]|nr:RluA family pseudouridine synthase [Pseudomonadota bacterium]